MGHASGRSAVGRRLRRPIRQHGNLRHPRYVRGVYEYPPCPLNSAGFLARFSYHLGRGPDDHGYGTQFYGTDGTLFINREGYTIWPAAPIQDVWETFGETQAIKATAPLSISPMW